MKKTTKWITGSGISGKRSSLDEKVTSTLFSLHLRMKRGWKNAEWKTRRMSMKRGRRRWKRVEHERQWSSWLKSWANRLWSLEKRCFLSVLFCEWILISRLNKRIMCSFLCVRDTYTHTLVFIVSTDWSSFLAWKTPWNDGHTTK